MGDDFVMIMYLFLFQRILLVLCMESMRYVISNELYRIDALLNHRSLKFDPYIISKP